MTDGENRLRTTVVPLFMKNEINDGADHEYDRRLAAPGAVFAGGNLAAVVAVDTR